MTTRRIQRLTVALLAASVVMATVDAQGVPVVTTKYGKIRGFYTDEAAIFYGVPYARPPVGTLRSVFLVGTLLRLCVTSRIVEAHLHY